MRSIKRIIVHCSDSNVEHHDNAKTIKEWHLLRGFRDIGYHAVVTKKGIEAGRPYDMQGAHCEDHNEDSIGICFTGRDNFTDHQLTIGANYIHSLCKRFDIPLNRIFPHKQFNYSKTCPNFNVDKEIIGRIRDKIEERQIKTHLRKGDYAGGEQQYLSEFKGHERQRDVQPGTEGQDIPNRKGEEGR